MVLQDSKLQSNASRPLILNVWQQLKIIIIIDHN